MKLQTSHFSGVQQMHSEDYILFWFVTDIMNTHYNTLHSYYSRVIACKLESAHRSKQYSLKPASAPGRTIRKFFILYVFLMSWGFESPVYSVLIM